MSIRDRLLDCRDSHFQNNNIYVLVFLNMTVKLQILNKILIYFFFFFFAITKSFLNQVTEYLMIYFYCGSSQNEPDTCHMYSNMQSMSQRSYGWYIRAA